MAAASIAFASAGAAQAETPIELLQKLCIDTRANGRSAMAAADALGWKPAPQEILDGLLKPSEPGEVVTAGFDFAETIEHTRALHPREAVRAMADRLLQETGGQLSDDATVLCLDWHGGHGRERDSHHGADQNRASPPLS